MVVVRLSPRAAPVVAMVLARSPDRVSKNLRATGTIPTTGSLSALLPSDGFAVGQLALPPYCETSVEHTWGRAHEGRSLLDAGCRGPPRLIGGGGISPHGFAVPGCDRREEPAAPMGDALDVTTGLVARARRR